MNKKVLDIIFFTMLISLCILALIFFWLEHDYANPELFALAVFLPALALYYILRSKKLHATVKLSSCHNHTEPDGGAKGGIRTPTGCPTGS